MENYVPAKDLAQRAANNKTPQSTSDTIKAIRDQVQVKFGSEKLGNLLSVYHVDRDRQMATLTGLGKEVLLSLMSQGILAASLAEALEISYDVFHEYIRITCSTEEIKHMEALQADNLVAEGLSELHKAEDKEDLARAKAIAEMNLKLARALSGRYAEQKPTTAVQVNNYGETVGGTTVDDGPVPYLQIVMPDRDSLPPLEEHVFTQGEDLYKPVEPRGMIDGEFIIFDDGEN